MDDLEKDSPGCKSLKKYADIQAEGWFSKDEAIRMLCINPSDYAERQRIRKAVDYAACVGEIDIEKNDVAGKGKGRQSRDRIRPEQFFGWAAGKWPEIESEDRIGPVWQESYGYLAGASALHAKPLEIPPDYEALKETYLAERDKLIKRARELQAENMKLKEQLATETMLANKWREWGQAKIDGLTGKKYSK